MDTSKNRCHVVRGTPAVLEDVKTEFTIRINIGVEHFAQKFHTGGLVGVRFVERQKQLEGTILKGRVGYMVSSVMLDVHTRAKNYSVPNQKIVRTRRTGDTAWWIRRKALEIADKPTL